MMVHDIRPLVTKAEVNGPRRPRN